MRLSKQQAAAKLEVSTATIERKIQRGELKSEKEPHGSRYRVWVISMTTRLSKQLSQHLLKLLLQQCCDVTNHLSKQV